jgi:hypothetical protein
MDTLRGIMFWIVSPNRSATSWITSSNRNHGPESLALPDGPVGLHLVADVGTSWSNEGGVPFTSSRI